MHKYELLRQRADEFRAVLEEYAQKDDDVADFLQRWIPWYERIQRREIRLPCYEYGLSIYFTNPDLSPLAERYFLKENTRLGMTCALFNEAILDWLSSPILLSQQKARGVTPSAILDELPPPEEEFPLPEPEKPSEPRGLRRFFYRWLSK